MTHLFLAQQTIDAVPGNFWKYFCIGILALLGASGIAVSIFASLRKPAPQKLQDDPPIEVRKSAKRYNHDLSEQRYSDHERRLAELEDWRGDLIARLEKDKHDMMQAGEERASRIHSHIENDRREMDRKIEAIPDRVIATLKNTGAI